MKKILFALVLTVFFLTLNSCVTCKKQSLIVHPNLNRYLDNFDVSLPKGLPDLNKLNMGFLRIGYTLFIFRYHEKIHPVSLNQDRYDFIVQVNPDNLSEYKIKLLFYLPPMVRQLSEECKCWAYSEDETCPIEIEPSVAREIMKKLQADDTRIYSKKFHQKPI